MLALAGGEQLLAAGHRADPRSLGRHLLRGSVVGWSAAMGTRARSRGRFLCGSGTVPAGAHRSEATRTLFAGYPDYECGPCEPHDTTSAIPPSQIPDVQVLRD